MTPPLDIAGHFYGGRQRQRCAWEGQGHGGRAGGSLGEMRQRTGLVMSTWKGRKPNEPEKKSKEKESK